MLKVLVKLFQKLAGGLGDRVPQGLKINYFKKGEKNEKTA